MQAPRFLRQINRSFTNRLMGPLAGLLPPLALVHHTGRKSGRAYSTPVLAFEVEGGLLTPLPYGTDTDWVLNLLAAGNASFDVSGREIAVANPRIVGTDEALQHLPALAQPLLRVLSLPGFLLLDRAPSA